MWLISCDTITQTCEHHDLLVFFWILCPLQTPRINAFMQTYLFACFAEEHTLFYSAELAECVPVSFAEKNGWAMAIFRFSGLRHGWGWKCHECPSYANRTAQCAVEKPNFEIYADLFCQIGIMRTDLSNSLRARICVLCQTCGEWVWSRSRVSLVLQSNKSLATST